MRKQIEVKVIKGLVVANVITGLCLTALATVTGGGSIAAALAQILGGVAINHLSSFLENLYKDYMTKIGRSPSQIELSDAVKQKMAEDAEFASEVIKIMETIQSAEKLADIFKGAISTDVSAILVAHIKQDTALLKQNLKGVSDELITLSMAQDVELTILDAVQELQQRDSTEIRAMSSEVAIMSSGQDIVLTMLQQIIDAIQQSTSPASTRPVQHNIPDVSAAVGRVTELAEVHGRLSHADTLSLEARGSTAAVTGVAGIGKSIFAAMYCHKYAEEYGFVCWRDMREDSSIGGLLLAVADKLGQAVNIREVPKEENQAELLVALLRQSTGLVVIDNVETILDADGNADGGWAVLFAVKQIGRSRVLLTSRQKVRAGRLLLNAYSIEGLAEVDGVQLLRQEGLRDEEALLKKAWKQAGGHPLALHLLAGLVMIDGKKLAQLLDEPRLWQGEVAKNLLNEVYGSLSEHEQALLRYISIYDRPDHFRHPVSLFEIEGMLRALPTDLQPNLAEQWTATMMEEYALNLSRRSLLNVGDERYTLHAIVRDYAYNQFDDAKPYHLAAATYFREQYDATHPDVHTHPAQNLADVQPLLDAYDQLISAAEYQETDVILYTKPLVYAVSGAWVNLYGMLTRWSETHLVRVMLERRLKAPESVLLPESRVADLGNLGRVYDLLGEYDKAMNYQTCSLAMAEQLGHIRGQAVAVLHLGILSHRLGQYPKALVQYKRANELAAQISEYQIQADAFGNLGNLYAEQKLYPDAAYYMNLALNIMEQLGNLSDQAGITSNLGTLYDVIGDYQSAIDTYTRALQIAELIGDPRSQAQAIGNIGISYRKLGNYTKAVAQYNRQLDIVIRIEDLEGQRNAWYNLGLVLRIIQQYLDAAACYIKAITIAEYLHSPFTSQHRQELAEISILVGEARWLILEAEANRLAADPKWRPLLRQENEELGSDRAG